MPKRPSTKKLARRPNDVNQAAVFMVRETTEERMQEKQPTIQEPPVPKAVSRMMAKMGSKGGRIGGKARLVKMTAEERSAVASTAAKARWAKAKKPQS